MFNLIYRDGAPENTGHYEKFTTEDDLVVGQLVSVSSGAASEYKAGEKPYGVVSTSAAGGEVTVLKITDEMIFRAPITATPAKGGTFTITVNGVGATKTSGDVFEVTDVISSKVVAGRFITKA
jgi:hypothetical protein